MERSQIAIIIPAFNEAATISAVISNVHEYGIPIVIDDGSSDLTSTLALAAGAEVVTHSDNIGYDGALNSGFARAAILGCRYAITIDADGQHNPAQLREFIDRLDQGFVLVLGVRDRLQRFSEKIFAITAKLLWGISDPLCGLKGYAMVIYSRVGYFDSFKSIGTQLAVFTIVQGCSMTELPVLTRERQDKPRFGSGLLANYKILRAMLILIWRVGCLRRGN